jgi:hypothetical protein
MEKLVCHHKIVCGDIPKHALHPNPKNSTTHYNKSIYQYKPSNLPLTLLRFDVFAFHN